MEEQSRVTRVIKSKGQRVNRVINGDSILNKQFVFVYFSNDLVLGVNIIKF